MSTQFKPTGPIRMSSLFDGRLAEFGILEYFPSDCDLSEARCLTDGRYYLWVYPEPDGFVGGFSRYAFNRAEYMLESIVETFNVKVISEYDYNDPKFKPKPEWCAWWSQRSRSCAS